METYLVGGAVRDEIMGLRSKDLDYSVVLSESDMAGRDDPFSVMRELLVAGGYKIYTESPQFFTIRAKAPNGDDADFVLARKEGEYSDGRRPDRVEIGTLLDDLGRRDFSCNAIAKDSNGNLIDPFDGQKDIANRKIKAVGNPFERIVEEDALRGLRAIRFAVTKNFWIAGSVQEVLTEASFHRALESVSTERIQQELDKAFKVSTIDTLEYLRAFGLIPTIFGRDRLHLVTSTRGK